MPYRYRYRQIYRSSVAEIACSMWIKNPRTEAPLNVVDISSFESSKWGVPDLEVGL